MALRTLKCGDSVRFAVDTTTGEQGMQMKIQVAEAVVKGNVLSWSPSVDRKMIKQTNEFDVCAVAYEAGNADAFIWVWKHGALAQTLMKDGTAATRQQLCIAADTDGRVIFIDVPSVTPAEAEHFKECGHATESQASGTDVLVLTDFHTL